MRIENYEKPHSSFLSVEKDMSIIVNKIFDNPRIQRLLYYTSPDALDKPNLTEDQKIELLESNNPEFRDNIIEFDIICHLDNWQLKDFELRPFKIAAELDTMFNKKKMTGIGLLEFLSAQEKVLSDEYAAICLKYIAYHGGEDKYRQPNPANEEQFQKDFKEYRKNLKEE